MGIDDLQHDPEIGTYGSLAYNPENDWSSVDTVTDFGLRIIKNQIVRPEKINTILLINPPFTVNNSRHSNSMPIGLLYLGSAINNALPNINLIFYDAHVVGPSWREMRRFIDQTEFDMLLISYLSAQADTAYFISDYTRTSKGAWVINGGVHPTLCPDDVINHCDAIVPYEGEEKILDFIKAIDHKKEIPELMGIWCKGFFRKNFNVKYIPDLNQLPFPAWELLHDISLYKVKTVDTEKLDFPIIAGRGCPFGCTFCSSSQFWKRRERWRAPEDIVMEMDEIFRTYNVDTFHFLDDNFMLKADFINKMSNILISLKRKYSWSILSRSTDIIKQHNLLKKLRAAGCVEVILRIEPFADQISSFVEKDEIAVSISKAVGFLKKADIVPIYSHILFSPGETISTYQMNLPYSLNINPNENPERPNSPFLQLTTPHIKTEFASSAKRLGKVLWNGPKDSYHHRVNFVPNSLLDDIPKLKVESMPDPLPFLGVIARSLYDWTQNDMRAFVRLSPSLWNMIDGKKSVRELYKYIQSEYKFTTEKDLIVFIALLIFFWAHTNCITSASNK